MIRRGRLKFVHSETTRHGERAFYFRRARQARRVRLPDSYGTEEFLAAYHAALRGERMPRLSAEQFSRRDLRLRSIFEALLRGCRTRARRRCAGFDMTVDFLVEITRRQHYCCALTGLVLDLNRQTGRNPYSPSVDRIDPKGGYTKDNVRVVMLAVNIMLADWGEGVFETIATAYGRNKSRKPMPAPNDAAPSPGKIFKTPKMLGRPKQ